MATPRSRSVELFIRRHVEDGSPINSTEDSGQHLSYVITAAKRRGLVVKKLDPGHYYFMSDGIPVGGIKNMITSLVSSTAISASTSKRISKELFKAHGVPVASGETFRVNEFGHARQYFLNSVRPCVVKPDSGRAGDGVTVGVSSEDDFLEAWNVAVSASRGAVLIEEEVSGVDVRALVVGGRVVAAASRLPAFVIGDGFDSVADLVAKKRVSRERNAYLRRMSISVDSSWLARSGRSIDSTPGLGEVVTLNGTVNLHQGGEHLDVTSQLHPGVKRVAAEAANAIPGLEVAGIDLMVSSLDDVGGAVALEANPGANISVHHNPAYGSSVNVGGFIVDEMLAKHRSTGTRGALRTM